MDLAGSRPVDYLRGGPAPLLRTATRRRTRPATNNRPDVLALDPRGRALLIPLLVDPANGANNARFSFLSSASRTFYPDGEQGADNVVESLRSAAGKNPHDKALTDLIGELVTRSDAFRGNGALSLL